MTFPFPFAKKGKGTPVFRIPPILNLLQWFVAQLLYRIGTRAQKPLVALVQPVQTPACMFRSFVKWEPDRIHANR